MWVYWKVINQLAWTVGYTEEGGGYFRENDYDTPEEAARRCNWLNGGSGQAYPTAEEADGMRQMSVVCGVQSDALAPPHTEG